MRKALYIASILCLGNSLVHLWELPGHLQGTAWGQGAFLLGAGVLQGLYSVLLLRWPTRRVVVAGIGVNLAVLVSHAVIRLLGAYKGLHGAGVGLLSIILTTTAVALLAGTLLDSRQMLRAGGALSLVAALMHLAQVTGRFGEWWGFGVFFLAVGAAQLLYWLWLPVLGRSAWFLGLGIAGNLSIISFWFFTHTMGIPYMRTTGIETFELRAGMIERVGVWGLTATLAEVVLVSLLSLLLAQSHRSVYAALPMISSPDTGDEIPSSGGGFAEPNEAK